MNAKRKQPELITAQQARFKFMDDSFVQSIIAVNEAIMDAAPGNHKVTVNIPIGSRQGGFCSSYLVTQRLKENGFDVILIHDADNGSSELTIDWSTILENHQ